jgi:hypothetical protein
MFNGISPEDKRLSQTHVYTCPEHGLFHLRSDGRVTKPGEPSPNFARV